MMHSAKIILLCVGAACVYGVLHDQVTVRVCLEYFTVGHATVFGLESRTLIALAWGVVATWWVGLIGGVALAMVARLGNWPKLSAPDLAKPIAVLLVVIAATAALSGITGYVLALFDTVTLVEPVASRVSEDLHISFIANLWAHMAAYAVGAIGGVILCVTSLRKRRRSQRESW